METEFLRVAALSVDGSVSDANGTPDIGTHQLSLTALYVGVLLVSRVCRIPVTLGEPTIDALPEHDAPTKKHVA